MSDSYSTIVAAIAQVGVDTTQPPAGRAPGGYNGTIGTVDLCKPSDTVGENGIIIVNEGNHQMDLRHTIAYHLWVAQGKPEVGSNVIEVANVERALNRVVHAIVRHRIYSLLEACGIPLEFRASDIIADNVMRTMMHADFVAAADRVYNSIVSEANASVMFGTIGLFLLYSLVAVSTHRKQNGGHSWFTKAASDRSSDTKRVLAVAGANSVAFGAYMEEEGHDGNHHLTDPCLSAICDAITGHTEHRIVGNITYAGNSVTNMLIHKVLDVGEAARDRWPAGELGKSGLITGLELVSTMVMHIGGVALISGVSTITTALGDIIDYAKQGTVTREEAKVIETHVAGIISLGVGYVEAIGFAQDDEFKSAFSHANRNKTNMLTGAALANIVKNARVHELAASGAIEQSLVNIGNALSGIQLGVSCTSIFDPDGISAEVGEDKNAAMMMEFMSKAIGKTDGSP